MTMLIEDVVARCSVGVCIADVGFKFGGEERGRERAFGSNFGNLNSLPYEVRCKLDTSIKLPFLVWFNAGLLGLTLFPFHIGISFPRSYFLLELK